MSRYIIDCDPEHFDAALSALKSIWDDLEKVGGRGHGWGVGHYRDGPLFFARRTKAGFSITQTRPDRVPINPPEAG